MGTARSGAHPRACLSEHQPTQQRVGRSGRNCHPSPLLTISTPRMNCSPQKEKQQSPPACRLAPGSTQVWPISIPVGGVVMLGLGKSGPCPVCNKCLSPGLPHWGGGGGGGMSVGDSLTGWQVPPIRQGEGVSR